MSNGGRSFKISRAYREERGRGGEAWDGVDGVKSVVGTGISMTALFGRVSGFVHSLPPPRLFIWPQYNGNLGTMGIVGSQ